jgi:hypothetical protein
MAKCLIRAAVLAVSTSLAAVPSPAGLKILKKLEYGFFAGPAFSRTEASSVYRDAWAEELLKSVDEETVLSMNKAAGPAFRLTAAYFLRPRFGVEAGLSFTSAPVPTNSVFRMDYAWKSGVQGTAGGEWPGTGRFASRVFFANAVWRHLGKRFGASLSAGPALFFNSVKVTAIAGVGRSEVTTIQVYVPPVWTQTTVQHLDAVPAEVEIPKTRWTAAGFNAGLGGQYALGPRLAAAVDLRLFFAPARDIPWTAVPGTYLGLLEKESRWTVGEDLARLVESRTTAFHLNPSFVQVSAGLKIALR